MKVRNHRLVGEDGKVVPFDNTPNKSAGAIAPEYLLMHYTAGGTLAGAVDHFNNPSAKASAHLVIGHDGAVVQMGRFDQKLWHAGGSRLDGRSGFNGFSIGIEIVNWGKLEGSAGNWRSWVGTRVDDARVSIATHKVESRPTGWEIYDEIQLNVAVAAAAAICDEYDIHPSKLIGHDDISAYRGKRDPGPLFDMNRFRGRVFGRNDDGDAAQFQVTAQNGLHLRAGPSVSSDSLALLQPHTDVEFIQSDGFWWLVSVIDGNGHPDLTGWVHSRWLAQI